MHLPFLMIKSIEMENVSVVIREATPCDAGMILEMIKDLAVQHDALPMIVYPADDLREVGIGKKGASVGALVAEVDGVVVGIALYFYRFSTWKGPTLHIEDLIVSPEYRGKGIGEALINGVVEKAREEGRDRVELDVEADNEKAIGFYKKKGFEVEEWYAAKLYLNGKVNSND